MSLIERLRDYAGHTGRPLRGTTGRFTTNASLTGTTATEVCERRVSRESGRREGDEWSRWTY